MKMPALRQGAINWRMIAAIPVAAAAVNILATFIAMGDTSNTAYSRLAPKLDVNKMQLLAPVVHGQQPIPFLGADARYAMCRFDTSKGPVTVSAVLPDIGWTLGIYRPDGTTAYLATSAPGKTNDVSVTSVQSEDRFLGLVNAGRKEPVQRESRLSITARDGVIVVRAPDKGLAYRTEIEKVLARAQCSAAPY